MHQQVFYNNRIPLILMALMLLVTGFISNASAVEDAGSIQSDNGFKILHHEPFSFNTPRIARDSAGLSGSANQEAEETLNVSFEAFGIVFELVLESNQQLISNLPLKQQQELNQSVKLYRGKLKDNDDSWARLTLQGNQVSGMIFDGNEVYIIDNPKEVSGILSSDDVQQSASSLIYRLADTDAGDQSCALDPESYSANDYAGLVKELRKNIVAQPAAVAQLDMAVVGDIEFVGRHSNPTVAVVERMNVVDGIFSEQVGVHLNLTEIKLLTDSTILTNTDAFGLMNQFSNFVGSASFNNPGLTHLFTGRDLDGSTIGFAWLRALCNEKFGTGLSQIRGTGIAGALTVAHEVGHNFGAEHDNQTGSACASTPRGFIMNPFLDGSDTFSQCSLGLMQPQIANAACIIDIDAPTGTDLRLILPQSTIAADIGQDFDFQVEVRNSGQRSASNAAAFISVPDELSVQSATVNGGSCQTSSNNVIQCDLDDINAESVKTINIKLQAISSGSFVINVEISADNDNSPANNQSTATINVDTVNPPPPPSSETDVAVELPALVSAEQNKSFDLLVDVKNTGAEKAINVLVDIPLSNGIIATFANINGGICTINPDHVTCNLGVINGNSVKTVNLILQASNVGSFVIDAAISASNDSNLANNTAQTTVVVAPPPPPPPNHTDVLVNLPKTQLTVPKGKPFDFLVEVKNVGLGTAKRVIVRIPISKGMYARRVKTIVGRGQCSVGVTTVTCSLGNMDPNSSRTISVQVQANNEGEFVIDASVQSRNDSNPDNNKSQATVTVEVESVPPITNALIEARFDNGFDGFVYLDDAFRNTSQPASAQGFRAHSRGFSGGGLRVVTGKGRNTSEATMSGGFKHTFSLENATAVTLSFRYKLTQSSNFNADEFSEALLSFDGKLMSPQQGNDYLARIQGDGRGGINQTTEWQVVSLDLGELSVGEHSLIIGQSSYKTAGRSKAAFIDIDDVVMTQTIQP